MEEEEADIQYLGETSEVRFAIQTYHDIFSDFDPRPLAQRGLSEDFLSEAKRAAIVKEAEKIDFIFMVPKKERNLNEEGKIESRLREYFRKHFGILQKEKNKVLKQGIIFTIIGTILMLFATFLLFKFKNTNLIASFFTVLLEPGGWFLFWEGLHQIVFESKRSDPNIEFHKKMCNARIRFSSV
ncbi:MAG: hypothetical protein NTW17_02225 [Candidatus Pacearchaeota archaeon]|nr:hypothetical protein [Candidatus Pacearchaeota archaeon]